MTIKRFKTYRSSIFRCFSMGLTIAVISRAALGQNGCIDSPENPTAVLGLIGVAGAAVPAFYRRSKAYFRSRR